MSCSAPPLLLNQVHALQVSRRCVLLGRSHYACVSCLFIAKSGCKDGSQSPHRVHRKGRAATAHRDHHMASIRGEMRVCLCWV
ncbi:hypothetical protein BD310DRAFT_932318 [Dichomitus squalens]|uniref:Uncharacterized protein n=1 Tax=Dichomitus squalens TaxID=114155 RepID=A0A4Q9PNT6_9APHY|nr:hypothetical protein BD310DRAFT_932318 [Dichomitus squalens]